MKPILSLLLALSASIATADEKPWHLQPMDTWLPGECYRSPHASGGGFAARSPDLFRAGDVVSVANWKDQYRITGPQVYRYSENAKREWWYYPATNQRTGKSHAWLVEHELTPAPKQKKAKR